MDSYIFDPPAQIPTPEHNGSDQEDQTAVSVLNLQLPSGAIAPNIWLEAKEQPALAAVKLWLRGSFASAASKDALDDSTVHYGELSKRVRAACASEEGQRTALDAALQAAEHMARKPRAGGDWFVASRIAAKLTLPKASAFGSSLVMNETRTYDERGARNGGFRTFFCQDLRVPTLIGVNAYERKGRQPVVVNFSVDFSGDRPGSLQDEMALLFPLERELVRVSSPIHALKPYRRVFRPC